MNETYNREYSWILDRDMEYAVFGDSGKVMFAFAPQNGHTYDFASFGMVETVRPWIEAGKLMVVCVDSIDEETTHAGVFFFRRPDLFDTLISLSGTFDARMFFHDYMDDLVYANSPVDFLPNMPGDHPWMDLYANSNIIICSGQGAWEDEMRRDAGLMKEIMASKGISGWVDFWGYDVNHDWPWWKKQLPYFVGNVLGEA